MHLYLDTMMLKKESNKGLGGVLLQEGRPIAFGRLTTAEQK